MVGVALSSLFLIEKQFVILSSDIAVSQFDESTEAYQQLEAQRIVKSTMRYACIIGSLLVEVLILIGLGKCIVVDIKSKGVKV